MDDIQIIGIADDFNLSIQQIAQNEFSLEIDFEDSSINIEIGYIPVNFINPVYKKANIHENQKLLTISQGYMIPDIVAMETEGNDVVISLGTYPGGNDIIEEYTIIGGQPNYLLLNYTSHINLTSVDLYISSDNWNGANLNVYITQKKLA
jgi:hypothetical protein